MEILSLTQIQISFSCLFTCQLVNFLLISLLSYLLAPFDVCSESIFFPLLFFFSCASLICSLEFFNSDYFRFSGTNCLRETEKEVKFISHGIGNFNSISASSSTFIFFLTHRVYSMGQWRIFVFGSAKEKSLIVCAK